MSQYKDLFWKTTRLRQKLQNTLQILRSVIKHNGGEICLLLFRWGSQTLRVTAFWKSYRNCDRTENRVCISRFKHVIKHHLFFLKKYQAFWMECWKKASRTYRDRNTLFNLGQKYRILKIAFMLSCKVGLLRIFFFLFQQVNLSSSVFFFRLLM